LTVNPVLESLHAQRETQLANMDALLAQVAADGRDLVEAERKLLEACRQRVAELDEQIGPLEAIEKLRDTHADTLANLPRSDRLPAVPRRVDGGERAPVYRSAGEFLVDYVKARGIADRGVIDHEAEARIGQARAVADQKTTNTPGILPTPIVGGVVSLIDTFRPLITSLGGARALGGIPGSTFTRPKITTHTSVGLQAAGAGEKTQLSSTAMVISPVTFAKATYGGTVDISRQDIDWTSPGAWDILVRDLANVYAVQTETAVAAGFIAALTHAAIPVATNTLADWTKALYLAAADSYVNAKQMPDRIWCSLDVWAALGSLVDVARVVFPADAAVGGDSSGPGDAGGSALSSFRGDILGLPRIVVPTFAAGTCIVGPSSLFEVYEEVIGLLSVIEPSILGVQVAYGGYVAFGSLGGGGFVPLTPPAGLVVPSMVEDGDAPAAEESVPEVSGGSNGGKSSSK
jgi:HK97 family phage major capsid protein